MFEHCKNIRKQEGGSVLMEAVLAFPVLVFLFGATLWCGDLMLARSRLAVADRQAAWWGASRFSMRPMSTLEKAEAVLDKLDAAYFSGVSSQGAASGSSQNLNQDVASLRMTRSDYTWTGVAASKLSLSYELPLWLQGILSIPRRFWQEGADAGAQKDLYTVDSGMDGESFAIKGETGPFNNKSTTMVFGRSEYGSSFRHPRNWSAGDISGRPNVFEFLTLNEEAVFEPWDKYIVHEIGPNKSWGENSTGECLWLAIQQLGATASSSDPWPVRSATASDVKAYKRFGSFESWSE